ncbi:MAG: hypothetical protein M0Z99_15455 [Betaproteobacteria bacterium]|nr:hypothetical protein [Betaproteobacteria bacterium]
MTPGKLARLQFLARVVAKECRHLEITDRRLFSAVMTPARAVSLAEDADLAERVEAFVGRFGRLQDTLADKLLPAMLSALGEQVGAQIDNLDRAERLGWVESADQWLAIRQLRNRMVHEYMEDMVMLAGALQSGHDFVATLLRAANAMVGELVARGWGE